MMTQTKPPQDIQEDIVQEFSACKDWDARYKKIIEFGRNLPDFSEEHRVEDNMVKGCQSQVWLHAELDGDRIIFKADSDAMIVRGLIALVLKVYSNQRPADILATKPDFLERIELTKNLSMQRNNGLAAVIKQIQLYSLGFQYKLGNA